MDLLRECEPLLSCVSENDEHQQKERCVGSSTNTLVGYDDC